MIFEWLNFLLKWFHFIFKKTLKTIKNKYFNIMLKILNLEAIRGKCHKK